MNFEFSYDGIGLEFAGGLIIGILIVVIAIYIVMSLLLSNLHKMIYGKGTLLAWFPITSTYILGKVTVSPLVGWILIILMILQFFASFQIVELISTVYGLANLGLYICDNKIFYVKA